MANGGGSGDNASAGFSSTTYEMKGAPSFEVQRKNLSPETKILGTRTNATLCRTDVLLHKPPSKVARLVLSRATEKNLTNADSAPRDSVGRWIMKMMSATTSQIATKRVEARYSVPPTSVRKIEADGVQVFYRAAGDPSARVVLLLHGFPSSSFMFRELIPRLADQYRVIAPDLPGFGFTEVPPKRNYKYSFDALALTIEAFTEALKIKSYALYVFDYGAPTGFRLAMAHPERVKAIISQNGNAYEEGLGDTWGPIRKYWAAPTAENREVIRKNILTLEGTRWQYTHGVATPESVAPESYTLDMALMDRPGNKEIQLDLFLDYASNVKLYPKFQEYFRKSKPPLLAIWGKNDPFFVPAGAEAFRKDLPNAQVNFLDTGHFATETHVVAITAAMREFLDANGS